MSGFPSAASQAGRLLLLTICFCLLAVLQAVSNAWGTMVNQNSKLSWAKNTLCPIIYLLSYIIVAWINSLAWFPERSHGREGGRSARVTMPSDCCISLDLVSYEKVCVSQDIWPKFRAPTLVWSQEKHIQMSAVCLRGCFSELGCSVVWSDQCQAT